MFKEINTIDWAKLDQAHGKASHVPIALKGLLSDNSNMRESSYWKLDNYVVLQSDLFEAAYYVIPFLIEILNSDNCMAKKYAYDLLFEITNGYSDENIKINNFDGEINLTDACQKRIINNYQVFIAEVNDISSKFRGLALDIIISIVEIKEKSIKDLSNILLKENKQSEFRYKLIEAIEELYPE